MASLAVELDGSVMLSVVPSAVSAICPVCGTPSGRRHTWYRRTALDPPWRKFTVRLRVWARRFFCDEPTYPRKIFASGSRDSCRAMAVGRRKRLACCWHLPNVLAVKPEPDSPEPRVCRPVQIPCVVCCTTRISARVRRLQRWEWMISRCTVDCWATAYCLDLAARRSVAVLPDDESATLATWLREHPGGKVVARDRGLRIRDGVRLGAPNVIQVRAIPPGDEFWTRYSCSRVGR
jgi:transposase